MRYYTFVPRHFLLSSQILFLRNDLWWIINLAMLTDLVCPTKVAAHTVTLTGWLREIKAAADIAAVAQGRQKRVVVTPCFCITHRATI